MKGGGLVLPLLQLITPIVYRLAHERGLRKLFEYRAA